MEDITGSATENGEQAAKETSQANPPMNPQDKTVPYGRFQEVLAQRKSAETALETLVAEMVQDVPEDFRDLIPASLPPAEKAAWIRAARAKGLFTAPVSANSPNAKRPMGKSVQDLSAMTPLQMLQAGYGRK